MINIKKDKKSDCFILTQTDKEGFHRQMTLTWDELQQIAKCVGY